MALFFLTNVGRFRQSAHRLLQTWGVPESNGLAAKLYRMVHAWGVRVMSLSVAQKGKVANGQYIEILDREIAAGLFDERSTDQQKV